jgi:uncharacterized protein (TIGR02391 family)
MANLPSFDSAQLEAACKVLGDTTQGLKGQEIEHILREISALDPSPSLSKWQRLYNAFTATQNKHDVGNHLILFINKAMAPARYAANPDLFRWRRDNLNVALAFAGYAVREDGKVVRTTVETTLDGARARAGHLRAMLQSRGTHPEVLKYCQAELLQENYFHAVLEAVKGVAERIRLMSGLGFDGAELVNQALSTRTPIIALNSLKTETELSEQKGIANLMIGVFGAIRNPTAHAPKVMWAMPEQDAIDVLGILSYIHRKLDNASTL